MSTVSNSSGGFFYDLFTPLRQETTRENKDLIDHVSEYTDSAEGAWDFFRVIEHALTYVKMLPSLAPHLLSVIEKVQEVACSAGIALSVPKVVANCNGLRHSLSDLFTTQNLPYSDPLRARKITQAVKKSFLDIVDLSGTLSQAALFIDNAKIYIFGTASLRFLEGFNYLTSAISDGAELITEYFKLQYYHSPEALPRNPAAATKLEERKRLSWMVIVKDVASVGGAAIALVGIVFGIAIQSIPVMTWTVLALSTTWLTMKLVAYFYDKIIVEAPIEPSSRTVATYA